MNINMSITCEKTIDKLEEISKRLNETNKVSSSNIDFLLHNCSKYLLIAEIFRCVFGDFLNEGESFLMKKFEKTIDQQTMEDITALNKTKELISDVFEMDFIDLLKYFDIGKDTEIT